jgi:hypothetical protein
VPEKPHARDAHEEALRRIGRCRSTLAAIDDMGD